MTGVILQAQGASAVIETRSAAGDGGAAIHRGRFASGAGRIRRLLGVLREGEVAAGVPVADEARGTPQPTLADITDLVRSYTRSTPSPEDDGDDVDDAFDPDELLNRPVHDTSKRTVVRVSISDGAEAAAPGLQASAHRIVQEAFTNVARHVGRASVDVRVSVVGDDLVVRVTNGPSVDPPATQITGAGLGLRGMRERAEALGGTFIAGPTEQGGWEVRATLPLGRPAVAAATTSTVATRTRRRQRADSVTVSTPIRIVLVDDQELVRTGLAMILDADPDLEVVGEAADGAAAVEIVGRERPDVVLMDVRMPGVDGIEATRRIVDESADRPGDGPSVLMLTTFDLDEHVRDALQAGASGFLLKDAPAAELKAAIRTAARGRHVAGAVGHPAHGRAADVAPTQRPSRRGSHRRRSPTRSARSSNASPAASPTPRSARSCSSPRPR